MALGVVMDIMLLLGLLLLLLVLGLVLVWVLKAGGMAVLRRNMLLVVVEKGGGGALRLVDGESTWGLNEALRGEEDAVAGLLGPGDSASAAAPRVMEDVEDAGAGEPEWRVGEEWAGGASKLSMTLMLPRCWKSPCFDSQVK